MTDEELNQLGVSRTKNERGETVYSAQCIVCGKTVKLHAFSTTMIVKCNFCKKEIAKKRKKRVDAIRAELLSILAEDLETDYDHLRRFERGTTKFGPAYYKDIDEARKAIDKFDSVPEVIACIELMHIGAKVIVHQEVGDFTVDFCLPDEKVVVEIDGSLYHSNFDKEYMRDYALKNMLGDGWTIRHVPADAVTKRHEVFGRNMKRLLNARREELGLGKLQKPKR